MKKPRLLREVLGFTYFFLGSGLNGQTVSTYVTHHVLRGLGGFVGLV